jgi:preprotein translocase subunit SecA
MVRFDIPEDEPIENRLINRSLETAQTRIEGFHFDSRKHTLEFDDVMNYQRKIIYDKRRKILLGDTSEVIAIIDGLVLADDILLKTIDEKKEKLGADVFANGVRSLVLQTIDMYWMDHLEMMDYLRGSVNLRAYGQRDPLVEYKKDGLKLFKEMERAIDDMVVDTISKVEATIKPVEAPVVIETREDLSKGSVAKNNKPIVHDGSKVDRNDPCPCGSGKKYKKCHGQ